MLRFIGSSFYENLMMALDTLRGNKLRSFLTILGVVVGVITVMVISSFISGINVAVEKQVESFGTRSIFLYKFNIGFSHGRRTQEERMRKPLTIEDVEALKQLSSIETAVPFLNVSNNFWGSKNMVTGKNGKTSSAVQLQGTLPEIEKTTSEILIEGRWFSRSESDEKANVCLIGSSVVDNYFPFGSPIGETLEIGGAEFRVIGVLEKKEQLFGGGKVSATPVALAETEQAASEERFRFGGEFLRAFQLGACGFRYPRGHAHGSHPRSRSLQLLDRRQVDLGDPVVRPDDAAPCLQ